MSMLKQQLTSPSIPNIFLKGLVKEENKLHDRKLYFVISSWVLDSNVYLNNQVGAKWCILWTSQESNVELWKVFFALELASCSFDWAALMHGWVSWASTGGLQDSLSAWMLIKATEVREEKRLGMILEPQACSLACKRHWADLIRLQLIKK